MSKHYYSVFVLFFILFFLQQERGSAQCKAIIGSNVTTLQGCDPFTVQFKDISQGVITQRTWDFGDDSTSTAQNPVHKYITGKNDTTFTVKLTIQCLGGAESFTTSAVTVFAKPNVDFAADTTIICALSDSVKFINLSESGVGYTYLWNFGDNTSSKDFQPYHTYSASGIYSVSLNVTNGNGCQRTLVRDDYISAIKPPSPAFSMSSFIGCDPLTISFTNNTTTSTDSIATWLWNYGDGSPSSALRDPPAHVYSNPDTLFTTLTATNALGCFNSTTQVIVVKETPSSTFNIADDVCLGIKTSVTYTGTANASAGYSWDFGGGTIVSGSGRGPYLIKWDSSGVKNVSLTVTVNGCSSTTTNSILVNPLPSFTLTSTAINDSLCKGDSIVFNVNPFLYPTYKFYRNGSLVQNSSVYSYPNSSLNNKDIISANVTDINGCTSSSPDSIVVYVKPTPVVSLTSSVSTDTICSGDSIVFHATPKGYDNYAFYDNYALIQNGTRDSLTYANQIDGHAIKVVATQDGCLSNNNNNGIITTVISPLLPPQVNCGTSTKNSIEFRWDAVSGAIGYRVSVEGGAFVIPSSGATGLTHLVTGLNQGDSATIMVKAIGGAPCYDTLVSTSTKCYALPCTAITFNTSGNTAVCKGAAATVSVSDISTSSYSLSWNGGKATTNTSYTFVPVSDTVISVAVTDLTQVSCKPAIKDFTITINPIPVVTLKSSLVNDTICSGDIVSFTASPATYENYKFYDGFALVQDGANPVYSTTKWVNGHIIKVISSDKGCIGSASNSLTTTIVQPLPPPQVNCGITTDASILFTWDSVPGANGYQVSVDGKVFVNPSSGINGLSHLITGLAQNTSSTLVVTALGNAPCGNSSFSLPATCYTQTCNALSFTISGDSTICEGDSVVLSVSNISASKYAVSWNGGAYSSKTSYIFKKSSSAVIPVSVKDSAQLFCPVVTRYFNITVTPTPVVSMTSSVTNDSICKGEAITFSANPGTYDSYKFYDGFALVQDTSNPYYTTTTLVDGHKLKVIPSNMGCAGSASNTITTSVVNPLLPPQVNCGNTTNNTITFNWDSVAGAKGYQVSINGNAFVVPSTGNMGLSHLVSGLSPGDSATIKVIASGNQPCGNSSVSLAQTCNAVPCNAISFKTSANPTICAGESVTLSVSNISTSSYSISWNGAAVTKATSYNIKPLSDTIISVKVTDLLQLACQPVTRYISIKVNPIPATTLTSSDINDTICSGATVSFSGSPATYENYKFYEGFALVQDGANPVYSTTQWVNGHSIKVIASDKGCVGSVSNSITTTTVQSLQAPQVNCGITTDTSILFTWDSVPGANGYQVSVDGKAFVNPSSGINGLSHLITGLAQNTSSKLVVMALGNAPCGNSSSSLPATCFTQACNALSFKISGNSTICEGDSVVLSVSKISASKYAVSWNGGAYSSDTSFTFKKSSSAAISVSVKDSAQLFCPVVTRYFNITVTPTPVVSMTSSAINDSICKGEAITFSATPGTYDNYKFYDGFALVQDSSNPAYITTSLVNGHKLKVIPSNLGCAGSASNTITTSVISPLLPPQVNCGNTTNNTITFTWDSVAGAKGYQVSVNGNSYIAPSTGNTGLSHLVSGLSPGSSATIKVIALGNRPCGNSPASLAQTCNAVPCNAITFKTSANPTICAGDSVTLSVSNISTSSYSISWNGAASTTTTTYKVIPSSDSIVSVTVTDLLQLACKSVTRYFNIKVNAIPVTKLTSSDANDTICSGAIVSFSASPAIYSNYTFYNGAGIVQNSANPVYQIASLVNGNTIRVLSNELGCTSSSNSISTKVMVLPTVALSSSLPNDSACQASNIVFTATAIPKGYMDYVFYYNGSPVNANSKDTIIVNNFSVGNNNTVTVLATDSFGCSSIASNAITTTVLPYTTVTLTSSLAIACQNKSVTFTAFPAGLLKYQFFKGVTEVQNTVNNTYITNTLSSSDTLTVIATNTSGCVSLASDSVSVTILPVAPPLLAVDSVALCNGESTKISVSVDSVYKNVSYIWSTGQTNNTITVNPSNNTLYYVTTTYNGCVSNKDSVLVQVDKMPVPVADAGGDVTICIGDSIQLNAKGGLYFEWLPDTNISNTKIANPFVNPLVTTQYQIKVSNLACHDSDIVTIIVDKCLTDITAPIPQIITPNGDGSNEYWEIPDMDYFTKNSLVIYNRWGNIVFNASPYNNTWKGQSNEGKDLTDGVYYYILDLGNNAEKKHTGYIVINR